MAIELDIELRRESIAHAFWSRVPFRHVDLRLIVTNNTDHTQSKVSLELLVPEAAVYDFLGDLSWAPTNKREVMGVISPNPVTLQPFSPI